MTAVAKLDAMKRIAAFVAVREKMAGTDPEVITESNGVPLLMSDLRAALSPAELGGVDYVAGELDRTAPPRIWLQIDTSGDNDSRDDPWPGPDHVTWQDESIGGLEIEYVRADLSTPRAAEGEKAE